MAIQYPSNKRLWRLIRVLERHNRHVVGIWGPGQCYPLILRGEIRPIPLTRYRFWVRRGYRRIFHITHFDLVD